MLSVILLSYFSRERINLVYQKLTKILSANNILFELIIIDDGSEDGSFNIALELERNNKNVKAFQLSKNYSSHYAVFAGLSVCSGNCAIPIPDDEQQPYDTIVEMYRLWQTGLKIIIPYRAKRNDGILSYLISSSFYRIINLLSDVKFPSGGADTFFIDREIIDIINSKIHPINTSVVAEVLRLGFNPCLVPYERDRGMNIKSRWTYKKKIRLFNDTLFSCSSFPIKLIMWIGLLFSLSAFSIIVFYSFIFLFGDVDFWGEFIPGWTSTVVIISFFSGIILLSLGIVAEYLWRIYEEVKNRPGYLIQKKKNENQDNFLK